MVANKQRETTYYLLAVFNIWLILQSVSLVKIFKGYSSIIQIAHGTLTFIFSLIYIFVS